MSNVNPSPAIEAPAAESGQRQMTYEEYLAWANEDVRAEWVNGEVIVHMPPKDLHQVLVSFLDRVLGLFVEAYNLGRLRIAPFEVRLTPDGPSREPDLLFIASPHLDRLTAERVVGPPDLTVEIVSDDSVHRDRVDKFDEYEAAGVAEYWIVDNRPERRRAWFYQLDEPGRYRAIPVGEDGLYRSAVLSGFWLKVEWLWGDSPNALKALAELLGPEKLVEAVRRAAT